VLLLYHFVQFGRPLSHPIFSDTGFERFKYFQIFRDFSKNKNSQPLAELTEMVLHHDSEQLEVGLIGICAFQKEVGTDM